MDIRASILNFKSPTVCFHCGAREGTSTYKVSGHVEELTGAGPSYELPLPVCASCRAFLDDRNKFFALAWSLFLCLVGAVIGYFITAAGILLKLLGITVGAVAGYAAGQMVAWVRTHSGNAATPEVQYDGKYFTFANEGFFRQFAALNPRMVEPKIVKAFGLDQDGTPTKTVGAD